MNVQDPILLQVTAPRQDDETGPADPETLQCPSTASSGRKLTRITLGGS